MQMPVCTKTFLLKIGATNHPGKGLDPPPQTGNAQMNRYKGAGAFEAPSQTMVGVVCKWYFQTSESAINRTKSWVPIDIHVELVSAPYSYPYGSK